MFPTKHALTWRWLFVSLSLFASAVALQWSFGGRFVIPERFWRFEPWRPSTIDEAGLGQFESATSTKGNPALALTTDDAVREIVTAGALPAEWVGPIVAAINDEARTTGLDPFLALAIITVESQFDPFATSHKGARGLMQLMPGTEGWLLGLTPDLSASAAMDPELNVRLGMRYFAKLQRSFGRVDRALQAYNCGPKRLSDVLHETAPLPFQSEVYAQRVLRRYHRYKRDYSYL